MDSITKRKNFIIDVVYFVLLIGLFYLFFKYAFKNVEDDNYSTKRRKRRRRAF